VVVRMFEDGRGWMEPGRIPKPFREESRLSREEGIRLSPEASYYSQLDFIIVVEGSSARHSAPLAGALPRPSHLSPPRDPLITPTTFNLSGAHFQACHPIIADYSLG
jgi:hypothetical protein